MDTNGVVENHLDENRNENTTEIKDYDVEVANNPEKEETDTADDVVQSKKIVARNKSEGDTDNDDTKTPEKKESGYTVFSVQELRKAMEIFSVGQKPAKTEEEASQKSYQFWYTQPVLKMHESADSSGPIESDKAVKEIRSDPYSLPHGFVWDTLNLNDPSILKELYILLNENYVEDEDSMFRFDYQPEFLIWALQPPGHLQEWHIGVRVIKTGRLVGFISAIPAKISIYETVKNVVEINFLCVHKKLRSKRVAPVLIREVTRRVNLKGIFQAVYTAGVILPKPVSTCRYWHRSLNPRKLIEAKFSHLSRNMTMQRTIKLYRLPTTTKIPGLRKMQMKDVVKAHRLLSKYLNKYDLKPIFSKEEFRHWFLPQSGVVDSYVVEDQGEITDMISFYTLPSTVMHHPVHTGIKAAYSFYNVPGKNKLSDLMSDALVLAKNDGFDVFNALDLMENKDFIDYLKFGVGDGTLQYYLYNWKCPTISSEKVGLVLQ